MEAYKHKVQYYESDQMGLAHHSNYVRWMEEARTDFLDRIGWNYAKMEENGIISPVLSYSCEFKEGAVFDDLITVAIRVEEFKGIRLRISYEFRHEDGRLAAVGTSEHCFLDGEHKPVNVKKKLPGLYEGLTKPENSAF